MLQTLKKTRGAPVALALAAWCVFAGSLALAHPLAPSLLELREQASGVFSVRWKTPSLRAPGVEIEPVLPTHCRELGQRTGEAGASHVEFRWQVDCGQAGLEGATLRVSGLDGSRTTALVRVVFADARLAKGLVRADAPDFRVSVGAGVAGNYLLLGFEHILLGPDHLLFVLGLMLLIVSMRKLVGAITSFTLGHSITLALAILDWIRLPQALVEVGIAISLVMVARELVRRDDTKSSWLRARPWMAAFGFGLLHGLGFAGALREAGLPSSEIPTALLFFNLGIEAGQLAFIAAMIVVIRTLVRASVERHWLEWGSAYAIGTLAVFWVIERTALLF